MKIYKTFDEYMGAGSSSNNRGSTRRCKHILEKMQSRERDDKTGEAVAIGFQ